MHARKPSFFFRNPLIYALLICVISSSLAAESFKPKFSLLSNRDGLSTILTRCILQDQNGYLWIGTMSGLNRYDGYDITVFKNIPGDSLSISDNRIRRLHETSDGSLWIGTTKGLNRHTFIPSTKKQNGKEVFERLYFSDGEDGQNDIWSFAEDKAGNLWVGTTSSIRMLPKSKLSSATATDFVEYIPKHPKWPVNKQMRVSALECDRDGNLWIATVGSGVFCKLANSDSVIAYQHDKSNTNSLSTNYAVMLEEDSKGNIWIGTYRGGLNRYDPRTGLFKNFKYSAENPSSISGNKVYDIVEHNAGYWVATLGSGINYFDPETETFTRYQHIETDPNSLANNTNRDILIDDSENLWILTNRGVNFIDLKPPKFQHIKHDPYNKNSVEHDYISSVYGDNAGNTWIGHNRGIDKLDKEGNFQFYEIRHNNPKSQDGFVYSIAGNNKDELFITTFGGGIFRFDKNNNRFASYPIIYRESDTTPDSRAYAIYYDKDGTLWVGNTLGLDRMLPDGRFSRKLWDADSAESIKTFVGHIIQDEVGLLWIGTTEGLYAVDLINKQTRHYTHDPLNERSLSNNAVNFLHISNNKLWIATNNGLSELNLSKLEDGFPENSFRRMFTRDGLADNYLTAIQSDTTGKLWIGTDNGLSCYNPKTGTIRNYGFDENLPTINFVQGAGARLSSGELIFGSQNGAIRFNPYSIEHNPYPPQIVLTEFNKIGRTELSGIALNQTRELNLSYDDRLISFEFAALDYTKSNVNRYAYKLEGYDENWIENGTNRTATYRNLPAGNYTFMAKGSNNDGTWSSSPAKMQLIIHPPYWETWWFRGAILLLVIGLLRMLYRYRVMKLLEIERMRVRIASDLHDDVGSTLTKISLYSDLIRSVANPEERNELLEIIGNKSRELVVTMSDIVWSIDARNDTLEDLLDRMRDFATSLFSATNIDYRFEIADLPLQRKLPIDTRQNMYLIFKEALTNAAKHSDAANVRIALMEKDNELSLAIHDNGVGIQNGGKRSGHGMQNMKMRAERIGGKLFIENGDGFTVRLQLESF